MWVIVVAVVGSAVSAASIVANVVTVRTLLVLRAQMSAQALKLAEMTGELRGLRDGLAARGDA